MPESKFKVLIEEGRVSNKTNINTERWMPKMLPVALCGACIYACYYEIFHVLALESHMHTLGNHAVIAAFFLTRSDQMLMHTRAQKQSGSFLGSVGPYRCCHDRV